MQPHQGGGPYYPPVLPQQPEPGGESSVGFHQRLMKCSGTRHPGLLSPLKGNDLGDAEGPGMGGWNFRATILAEAGIGFPSPTAKSYQCPMGSKGWFPSHRALTHSSHGSQSGSPGSISCTSPRAQIACLRDRRRLQTLQGGEAEVEVEVTMKGQYPPMDPFLQPPSLPSSHFFIFLPERV